MSPRWPIRAVRPAKPEDKHEPSSVDRRSPSGPRADHGPLESLQRTAGNRAVVALLNTRPEVVIQRAMGVEFQTGWGIVRSLPHIATPNQGKKKEERDVDIQGDWPDVPITHEMAQTGKASPTGWSLKGHPKLPPMTRVPNQTEAVSKGAYQLGHDYHSAVGKGAQIAWPTKGREHYQFFKGQNISPAVGNGFQMSVDDADTPLGAELEWVVHPPLDDRERLKKVLTDLTVLVNKMVKLNDRESFFLSEVTKNKQHRGVELQPGVKGKRTMEVAPQVTGGVSVDRLPQLFKDIATEGESPLQKKARKYLGGSNAAIGMSDVAERTDGSPQMKGLMGFIARYVVMGDVDQPMLYAKANTQFLARTDLAALFDRLPKDELQEYENEPEKFRTFVGVSLGKIWNENRRLFKSGIQNPEKPNEPIEIDLTLGEWVDGLCLGKDLLGAKYWKKVKESAGDDNETLATATLYQKQLESMGNLGDKMDQLVDDLPDDKKGFVMEFRGRVTPDLAPKDWVDYGLTIFDYLQALNHVEKQKNL